MALLHCHIFSESLGRCCAFDAIVPQASTEGQIGITERGKDRDRHPTLWLLHGLSDDQTIWQRRTSIERYAAAWDLAVIMPDVERSFYADMASGPRYWNYLSQELPAIARRLLPLSDRREENFAAGLSMGGYGAFKLALQHPDRYAFAASLSGALDPPLTFHGDRGHAWDQEMTGIFGDLETFEGSEHDLFHLARQVAAGDAPRPGLWACCGTDDGLLEHNRRFRSHLQQLGLTHHYVEHPGRAHEWGYWDEQIQAVLASLPRPAA